MRNTRWTAAAVAVAVVAALVAARCADRAVLERESLAGTWQLDVGDGGCLMTITTISGGIEGVSKCNERTSVVNVGPSCDRVARHTVIYGKLVGDRFDGRVDDVRRYSGSGCATLGLTADTDVTLTEGSVVAQRSGGGSGAFEGTWSVEAFGSSCTKYAGNTGPCIERMKKPADISCSLQVRDVGAADFGLTCTQTGETCQPKASFSGSYTDGRADFTASWTDCDGSRDSGRFLAIRKTR